MTGQKDGPPDIQVTVTGREQRKVSMYRRLWAQFKAVNELIEGFEWEREGIKGRQQSLVSSMVFTRTDTLAGRKEDLPGASVVLTSDERDAAARYRALRDELHAVCDLIADLEKAREEIKSKQRSLANTLISARVEALDHARDDSTDDADLGEVPE